MSKIIAIHGLPTNTTAEYLEASLASTAMMRGVKFDVQSVFPNAKGTKLSGFVAFGTPTMATFAQRVLKTLCVHGRRVACVELVTDDDYDEVEEKKAAIQEKEREAEERELEFICQQQRYAEQQPRTLFIGNVQSWMSTDDLQELICNLFNAVHLSNYPADQIIECTAVLAGKRNNIYGFVVMKTEECALSLAARGFFIDMHNVMHAIKIKDQK